MTEQEYYDLTIIGGGPVGMFAATYARMRRLPKRRLSKVWTHSEDRSARFFPSKKIYDIPGFEGITGAELIARLEKQTMAFSPDVFLGETVKNFEKNELGFKIETTKRITYSKAIIIAAGVGAFEPRRLAAKNSSDFENKNVHYFVKDPQTFAKKDVAIAGGGDSAVDWALELEHVAKSVHIIHRRDRVPRNGRKRRKASPKLGFNSYSVHGCLS